MYFASRLQAGRMLAAKLAPKYRYENCVVVALNDGGVMVGAQVAMALHCPLALLQTAEITLPREPGAIAGITDSGTFSYNHSYSDGEIDELSGEYYGLIEQEKLTKLHELNRLLGHGGTINRRLLKGHCVILVADGLEDGFLLDLAAEYIKPVAIKKLIVAVPLASVAAVDHMHVLADDLYVLSVIGDYMGTDHYYDKHDVPDHKTAVNIIEQIILNWK